MDASRNGRAHDLQTELETLFSNQNKATNTGATLIPASYLRVTVAVD
jgi:hypothetical protein